MYDVGYISHHPDNPEKLDEKINRYSWNIGRASFLPSGVLFSDIGICGQKLQYRWTSFAHVASLYNLSRISIRAHIKSTSKAAMARRYQEIDALSTNGVEEERLGDDKEKYADVSTTKQLEDRILLVSKQKNLNAIDSFNKSCYLLQRECLGRIAM
ncbi:hypothetical protein F2Q68_00030724 [Brassica cretica]|nr:hypothetical protein F2Q68_00030724 [Brassica cretica]